LHELNVPKKDQSVCYIKMLVNKYLGCKSRFCAHTLEIHKLYVQYHYQYDDIEYHHIPFLGILNFVNDFFSLHVFYGYVKS